MQYIFYNLNSLFLYKFTILIERIPLSDSPGIQRFVMDIVNTVKPGTFSNNAMVQASIQEFFKRLHEVKRTGKDTKKLNRPEDPATTNEGKNENDPNHSSEED